MDSNSPEAELEKFRRQWREEVSGRSKKSETPKAGSSKPSVNSSSRPTRKPPPSASSSIQPDLISEGRTFHDLEDNEEHLKLKHRRERSKVEPGAEPGSALEHYERAVERETQGSLGDSVSLYRKAFKLDARVQEEYKEKYFPHAVIPPRPSNQVSHNANTTSSTTASQYPDATSKNISELLDEFSKLRIPGAELEPQLPPSSSCPVASIPEEVLVEIFLSSAVADVANSARLTQVCKRFAYLNMTEDRIWKRVALGSEFGFRGMLYRYVCDLTGAPIVENRLIGSWTVPSGPVQLDLTPTVYPTYRSQFRFRPRIRFNGCYISTVNYSRAGGASQSQYTWSSPVHIVTYYRYLRFFRDGTVISLLTTAEPAEVVHNMTKDKVHDYHSGVFGSSLMKDALLGRWRLSGSSAEPSGEEYEEEAYRGPGEYIKEPTYDKDPEEEGELHIETEGVVPKYMWKMQFALTSSGRKEGTRNNKLAWKGFWSYNRLADDWGEFGLKNDRAYYWSRVKSYGFG